MSLIKVTSEITKYDRVGFLEIILNWCSYLRNFKGNTNFLWSDLPITKSSKDCFRVP